MQAVYAAQTGGRDQLVTLGLSGNSANLRAAAMLFLNQNRNTVLPRATSQQNNEIMLRAEVRWAIDFKKRAEHHSKLTANSPLLFRVATCVLQHLFPTRGFKMHQFAVFNITDPNEAAVGESILSHLAASYVGYGGFNLSQAGVQTSSFWNSNLNWPLVTEQAVNNGYFNQFQTNSNALRIHLEARKEKNRVSAAPRRPLHLLTLPRKPSSGTERTPPSSPKSRRPTPPSALSRPRIRS